MIKRTFPLILAIVLLSACGPVPVTQGPAITDTPAAVSPEPASPTPTPASATPVVVTPTLPLPPPPPQSSLQFLAYIRDRQLEVTDVTNGVKGGTSQYTLAGESDKVRDLAWSPSGEFVAFTSEAKGAPHIMYIFALGASTPTDLGAGTWPAWSPDSKSIAYIGGSFPDENIYMTSIDNPAPVQLTFEKNHAWGKPAFIPDGSGLIVTTAAHDNMGASGNTVFTVDKLVADGGGSHTILPGSTAVQGARLPFDMKFSPDGTRLAFSTSSHMSACGAPSSYYVINMDGSGEKELSSPSLKSAENQDKQQYYQGLSFGWAPSSDAIYATGAVVDCDFNSSTTGQALAGPQVSLLRVDGSEGMIIPGMFYSPSVDRSGKMIAVAHYQDPQDQNPMVEIYNADTGQLMLTVGPGSGPVMQP
ncbi:MAG: hypothetical protein ACM3MF_06795 [Anaerolineae bacterium]